MINGKPRCFSQEAWLLWLEAARSALPPRNGLREHRWCSDCTPEYKQKMVDAKRCAHPEVLFRVDEDGFLEGYAVLQRER